MFYNLKENDILYFLHIPKTAGVSFVDFLDNYFDSKSIFPYEVWHKIPADFKMDLKNFNFIRGHFGYGIHRISSKNVINITMLRDPLSRTISNYEHYKRTPGSQIIFLHKSLKPTKIPRLLEVDFENYQKTQIDDGFWKGVLQNMQTRYLALDLNVFKEYEKMGPKFSYELNKEFSNPEISNTELLDIARRRLQEFTFFGITEKFLESTQLLCFTFGWRHNRYIRRMNIKPKEEEQTNLSESTIKTITDYNEIDNNLYEFANKIFDERYNQMKEFLIENYQTSEVKNLSESDLIFKLLDLHFEKHFAENAPVNAIDYSFNKALSGTGWYSREHNKENNVTHRWSGPQTNSRIDFPALKREGNYRISIEMVGFITEDILSNFKLFINNNIVDLKSVKKEGRNRIFEGVFFFKKDDKGFLSIEFKVPKTISPSSISKNSKDIRPLGIGISKIVVNEI